MKKTFTNKVNAILRKCPKQGLFWRKQPTTFGESAQCRKPRQLQALERHCSSNACRTVRKPAFLKPRRGVPSIALGSACQIQRSCRPSQPLRRSRPGRATPACLRAYTHREACLAAGRHRRSDGTNRLGVAPPGLRAVGVAFLPRPPSCLRCRQLGHPGLSKASSLRGSARRGR